MDVELSYKSKYLMYINQIIHTDMEIHNKIKNKNNIH